MIAAVYGRKCSEQNDIPDESKSVTRQVEHARAYAMRKGWNVADEYIYVDDGISGAEFANRPGFVKLMNALQPRPPFQILIMSEESRLGRESIETAFTLKRLVMAGVRVFFYLEDRERTLDTPIDKVMLSLTAFADELEREKVRQRVTDAMLHRARRGHWLGGYVYGYDRVEEFGEADVTGQRVRQCVRLHINATEAVVIRQIFALCVRGLGIRRIAKLLNAEAAPAPRPKRNRPRGWAPSSIGAILYRPLYRGEFVWVVSVNWWKSRKRVINRRGDRAYAACFIPSMS